MRLASTLFAACLLACMGPLREPAVRGLPLDDPDAALSVVWVGHATVLIRLGHRFILTDPNLSGSLVVVPRIMPPSLTARQLPPLQLVLLSHLHIDHFDRDTLHKLPASTEILFPPGSDSYLQLVKQRRKESVTFWKPITRGGLTVTAVPVKHQGGRYVFDALWNKGNTGYVIEGFGKKIFFAGDTGADEKAFREIARRFPGIDLALIPIAPSKGKNPVHASPREAVDIFEQVGARYMIPIHFESYPTSVEFDAPRKELLEEARKRGLENRIFALYTGERWVDGDPPWVTRKK